MDSVSNGASQQLTRRGMIGLRRLSEEIRNCQKCRLRETRRNALPGEGNPTANVMLVAQAPGMNEDREGRMFIGPSGRELNRLLREADVDRTELYLTNLIKCILPRNRKPRQDEIQTCSPYLDEEIRLVNPSVIATLGYYATKYLFTKYQILLPKSKTEFSEVYGKLFSARSRKILPLRHPAALLYDESVRETMAQNYGKLKTLMRPMTVKK
jgi:uracil-DNA glycosylase family 4